MKAELRFRAQGDGTAAVYVVGGWPETTAFAQALLASSDPSLVRCDGDRVHCTVPNGEATYRLTEQNVLRPVWRAIRLYGWLDT